MPTFQIQFRRDVTANWESCNPVLMEGELGLEFKEDGTRLFKLGDGQTAWLDLPYMSGPKGDKFEFSDFTPEQIEMLRGPKGEAFKYEDFTPAQLAALIGPKGDDGSAPEHEWIGTELKFKNADGSWGQSVDLKGPKGDTTVATLPIATDSVLGGVKVSDGLTITADGLLSVNKATTAPEAPSDTPSVGSGNEFALANHVHPKQDIEVPSPATATPLADNGKGAVGSSEDYARADHVHPAQSVPGPATATPKANGTAAVGTSIKYAREDHVHSGITVTTGSNSVGSWRLYSDGYCEQWGKATNNSYANWATITLPKAYKDANYNLQASIHNSGSTEQTEGEARVVSKQTFKWAYTCRASDGYTSPYVCYWKTCGYVS